MSLKPPKKSDLNKSWMKARQDRLKKIQPEYHLIVTEGTDTEPAYFGVIRDVINSQYREKVRLDICGEGDNTVNLFRKAKQNVADSPNGYRHVWVVYDTDDFPAEHIDKYDADMAVLTSVKKEAEIFFDRDKLSRQIIKRNSPLSVSDRINSIMKSIETAQKSWIALYDK